MTDANASRELIVERLRAVVDDQRARMKRLLPEAESWESRGLDVATGFCLAAADRPEKWERIRQLGDAMLATLLELEAIDPSGPGPQGGFVARLRWGLGKSGEAL